MYYLLLCWCYICCYTLLFYHFTLCNSCKQFFLLQLSYVHSCCHSPAVICLLCCWLVTCPEISCPSAVLNWLNWAKSQDFLLTCPVFLHLKRGNITPTTQALYWQRSDGWNTDTRKKSKSVIMFASKFWLKVMQLWKLSSCSPQHTVVPLVLQHQHRTDAQISTVTAVVFPGEGSSVWKTADSAGCVIWLYSLWVMGAGPLPGKTKPNPIRR